VWLNSSHFARTHPSRPHTHQFFFRLTFDINVPCTPWSTKRQMDCRSNGVILFPFLSSVRIRFLFYANRIASLECVGWDISVRIATRYGADGPGIDSRWGGGFFLRPSRLALGLIQRPIQWVPGLFPGGELYFSHF
jgi:hypothetical protein